MRSCEVAYIPVGKTQSIRTGIAIEIPEGFEGEVRGRSGLASKHGICILHGVGTIDSDYRGELQILLHNAGSAPYWVAENDRIAQIVIAPVSQPDVQIVDELTPSDRGNGGFGSTGK